MTETTTAAVAAALKGLEGRYASSRSARSQVRKLSQLLAALCAAADQEQRVAALESLLSWMVRRGRGSRLVKREETDPRTQRLQLLLLVLEGEDAVRGAFRSSVSQLVREGSLLQLLVSTGMAPGTGLFAELSERVAASVLPKVPDPRDLSRPLVDALGRPETVAWLAGLGEAELSAVADRWFEPDCLTALEAERQRAVAHVATRVAALGIADDVLLRSGGDDAPFLALPGLHSAGAGRRAEVLGQCRAACAAVFAHLDRFGVGPDLVFRLECIGQGLTRLEVLLRVERGRASAESAPAAARALLTPALAEAHRRRSVVDLFRTSSRQLARKMIERAGVTGAHYITRTRGEWLRMLGSAAGGGVLTAGTTFVKFEIAALSLPFLFEGLFHSTNYAVSFLLMQLLGLTLATKQPAVTAAALAGALEEARDQPDARPLVDMVARITRSQLAAVLGNLGLVIPAAVGVHLAHHALGAGEVLGPREAAYVVRSLDPFGGPTAIYAAFTGVFLWFSSVGASWVENWVAFHRLPDALAAHRGLRRVVGAKGAAWLGRSLAKAAGGFGGNVTLGLMLGMSPVVARFAGIPLDVRHVTLSTGALTLALLTLGVESFVSGGGLRALAGLGVIAVLNFGLSFLCALWVALRAREVGRRKHQGLARTLLGAMLRQPGRFLFPPRSL